MKQGILIIVLFSVLFGLSNCTKTENDILYNKKYLEEIKATRKEIGYFMSANFIPGASVAILKDGELIYSEAIGLASRDLDVIATRDSKFRVGSISELFTVAIYFKMLEEGILQADSSIQHYYPEFPKKESSITLQHLVQHTSGIREPVYKEQNSIAINVSLEKGIDNFKNDDLIAPTGAYQTPSYYNYNLLGLVMTKAEKKHFAELFRSYLSDTLHLENTVIDNPYQIIKNRSDFYDHNMISQVVNASTLDLGQRAPSEGVLSTAEDLVKLGNAFISDNYFTETTREKIFTKIKLSNGVESNMANGWMIIRDRQGNLVYGKEGTVKGGSASIIIYPEENLVIAFVTNLTNATSSLPIFKIANPFLSQNKQAKTPAKE